MIRAPYTPDALVDTRHRLVQLLVLLPTCISEQLCLLSHTLCLQIPYADSSLGTVDVMCSDHRVFPRSWRDGNLDLWVALRKGWEGGLDEAVHAARGAGPVAVMEFEFLALENEGADAILPRVSMDELMRTCLAAYLRLRDRLDCR